MCGIVGYLGYRKADRVIINALKRLEYRGYDSWGVAVVEGNKLEVHKQIGAIGEVESHELGDATLGIGHTRWATHGKPSDVNAHPHVDCKRKIAVVHNGIIENYLSLKNDLIKEGHKFVSETDTEVIAHLVEKYLDGRLEEAVRLRSLLHCAPLTLTAALFRTFGPSSLHAPSLMPVQL